VGGKDFGYTKNIKAGYGKLKIQPILQTKKEIYQKFQ
jgi:hypothetical protein